MKVCKLAAAAAVAGCWTAAQAAVMVTNVTVQQRWPWNGKVDIDYEVLSDDPDDSIFVYPEAKENDRNIAIAPRTLSGDGVETAMVGARVKPGKHRMTWHMDTDEPTLHSSSFTVTMHAVKGGMYLVVDLSPGPNAESYPIRYSDTPPDIADDACRTTNLWLRLCLPGTFMMGSPSDEVGRQSNYSSSVGTDQRSGMGYETQHMVTLTKPFYIGIFEFTQRQYELVKGGNPLSSYTHYLGDTRPAASAYVTLRGSVAGAAWPIHSQVDPTSFLGLLRARTGCLFDLPTEAQWEYACRAGTSTAFNDGQDTSISGIGRCGTGLYVVDSRYTAIVGRYKPNAWGLYDMHGNVAECCLDYWTSSLGTNSDTDPLGPTSSSIRGHNKVDGIYKYNMRVVRGGGCGSGGDSYITSFSNCRSAARNCTSGNDPSTFYPNIGFRVVATPVVQ